MQPAFLITIDTEGDNLWAKPRHVTTRNALYLPRFQALCEAYGLKPTYLTNWEMAHSPFFQAFGNDVLQRGVGEIGMHLHAWNSPPIVPLTADDHRYQPYLIEYPEHHIREKVRNLTGVLEDTFGVAMTSHRAGRWSFNETYAKILVEHGYCVDCSVTPHISWQAMPGDPARTGGSDFSHFPETGYFVDLDDISRPGTSPLLELPVTILQPWYSAQAQRARGLLQQNRFCARVGARLFPPRLWLRPNGHNGSGLLNVLSIAQQAGYPYVQFMLHSSEFMPGGSPYFRSSYAIETLYYDVERLFSELKDVFVGQTLYDYYQRVMHTQAKVERYGEAMRYAGESVGVRR